jgi:hypothetical protein
MSDLRTVMRTALGDERPAQDALQRVIRRSERRARRRRRIAAGLALGVFAAAGWLTWTAFRPVGSMVGSTESGTYLLSEFEVGAHLDPATEQVVPGKADVTFTKLWSSGEYPGVHRCELRVLDAGGSEIGSLSFEMSALTSKANRPPLVVPVTGSIEGATATGSCGPERLDAPVAYVISNERLEYVDGRLAVVYEVVRPEGVPDDVQISTQACTTAAWDSEGRLLGQGHFTLDAPEGTYDAGIGLDERLRSDATQGTVQCVPFVHAGEFPEPKRPTAASPSAAGAVIVPDVVGLSEDAARTMLEEVGLTISVATEPSNEVASGIVAAQEPSPGVAVDAGTAVTIRVSQGPGTQCVQATTSGDFDGEGTVDAARLVALVPADVSCSRNHDVWTQMRSQQVEIAFESGQTLDQSLTDCQPCLTGSLVFAATDLDGDGRDELAIDVGPGAATDYVEFYRVDPNGISPLVVSAPGDPPYVEPGPAILGGGFDSGQWSPIQCTVAADGTDELVSVHAENLTGPITGPWKVHTTTMVLEGDRLVVVSMDDVKSENYTRVSDVFQNGCA